MYQDETQRMEVGEKSLFMKIKILHSLKTFIIKGFLIENSEIHQIDSQMGRLIKF